MFAYEDITAAFNTKYPGIKATATQVSKYKDKRLTAIASNTLQGAWVWLTYGWELPEFAQKSLLRPLDSYIASDKVNMQDFWPIVLTDTTYNGKNYGMTNHPAVVVLWQDTDLARTAGLDTTKPPASWDALLTATQKLTQRSGATFTQIGNDPTSHALCHLVRLLDGRQRPAIAQRRRQEGHLQRRPGAGCPQLRHQDG